MKAGKAVWSVWSAQVVVLVLPGLPATGAIVERGTKHVGAAMGVGNARSVGGHGMLPRPAEGRCLREEQSQGEV